MTTSSVGPDASSAAARLPQPRSPEPVGAAPDPSGRARRLAPGLWQVAGPGITHPWDGAAYLVRGSRALLVDVGSGLAPAALDAAVASTGCPPAAVTAVVATHGHLDHIGDGARWVAAGVPVHVHDGDAAAVRSADPVRTCAQSLYGTDFRPFEHAPLADGDLFDLGGATLEVVHTPGHTPGSVCLVATVGGRRVLLAGDTLWGGFSASVGSDEDAWRRSLARLASLPLDGLSFGHGITALVTDPGDHLAEALAQFAVYYNPWFAAPKRLPLGPP